MNRRTVPFVALALSALFLTSCAGYRAVLAPASPAPGTKVAWPGTAFSEVRAYCYDYTAESDPSFFIAGRMHEGVMDSRGVKLTPAQTIRLLAMLTVSKEKQDRTPCYKPHHAFVFYDAAGKPVAVFEMCFGCNRFRETPDGLPEYVDTPGLWSLCEELNLPLGKGNKFYTDACNAGRAAAAAR